jgi:hypothetical protein
MLPVPISSGTNIPRRAAGRGSDLESEDTKCSLRDSCGLANLQSKARPGAMIITN